jgi:DNA-binding transcriptional regulator LsrR (DeoR family)
MDRREKKLDLAARAAWLYYVANNTQDEIAAKLNVSRQAAQRLVALADAERLIRHRLEHPLSECVELSEKLRSRFDLSYCDIVPSSADATDPLAALGAAGATCLESFLVSKVPIVVALTAGRSLRAMVNMVSPMNTPHHKIVSLQGHMSPDGRTSHYEVVISLADRVNAQAYLLPTPVLARDPEERIALQKQRTFQAVQELVRQAKVAFVGIAEVAWNGPLQQDGYYTEADMSELLERGAVGSILAWAYDRDGRLIESSVNDRVAGPALSLLPSRQTIALAVGANKVEGTIAALRGQLISGLITDEATARLMLAQA